MDTLDKYIFQLKKKIKKIPSITEAELIRYVYLDLGSLLSFDENFRPFGNSKTRQNLYKYHCQSKKDLDECMKKNKAICKSISHILEYVLKQLGTNIITVVDQNDIRKCPHVFNIIKQKNGLTYVVDLQEDIPNIQSHYFTKNFGIDSIHNMQYIISRFELEKIDKKIGYIDNNYYADEYLYLLQLGVNLIDDFGEKVKFVLENIDVFDTKNMGYIDMQWHHKDILEYLFSKKDFNYEQATGRIKMIDCYKDINGMRNYINGISVQTTDKTEIYLYNKIQSRYVKLDIENFAKAVNNGLVIHNSSVPGLGKVLKKQILNKNI